MSIQSPSQNTKDCLNFKGSLYPLTTLHLFDLDLSAISFALDEKIKQAPNFFKNAPVILDFQKISEDYTISGIEKIISTLQSKKLHPIGIRSKQEAIKELADKLGLALFSEESESRTNKQKIQKPLDVAIKPQKTTSTPDMHAHTPTKLVTHPIRSGQQIYAPGGDLIVMAPVSPGAELLADGHIHVHGALRGRALAGINGDTNAMIYCKSLEAELVSIAGQYQISESLKESLWKQPACIAIKDGRLQISPI